MPSLFPHRLACVWRSSPCLASCRCAAPAWEGCQQGGSTAGATERSVTLRLDVDLAPPPECGRPCATPLNPAATCAAFEGLFSCAGSSELLGCNCTGCCAGEGKL